ncbi:MAG: L-aspartate oxidase [Candidatus Cloacimonadales bacterium]
MRKIYDVIIVGTGIAGLSAAAFLQESGLKVLVLTKEADLAETNTNYAQGGIIAWKEGDRKEKLKKDIFTAGVNYNFNDAVELFAEQGPKLVFDFFIKELGIDFNRTTEGEFDYTEEAAHSTRRILHYADHTGEKIQSSLIDYVRSRGIEILADHTCIDLITNSHHSSNCRELYLQEEVMGVYVLDNQSGEIKTLLSGKVILATGGLGNLYQHTTNPEAATGDGVSMAYRAGADIINSEFVQFHPTCLFHKDIERFLISEALRGEGAKLIDHEGREFMQDYSPLKELAPRDVVARAIYEEMSKSGKQYMLLDLANNYQGQEPISKRFSKIYQTCLEGGIDITQEPIPIVPAAHYFCGGIKVDLDGKSTLRNLYAIGETSCTGLHGANRLASASLLEGLLWAKRSTSDIKQNYQRIAAERFAQIPDWQLPTYREEFDDLLLLQDWKAIQLTMWNYAGIIRTGKGLARAKADLDYFSHRIMKFYKQARLTKHIIELRNGIVSASIIADAALHNKKSLGCHFVRSEKSKV